MIEIPVPGQTDLTIENIVFDFNGTLAADGIPLPGIRQALKKLAENLAIYLLTSDTHGTVRAQMDGLPLAIHVMSSRDHAREKADFVNQLGARRTIAVGNGSNDAPMLRTAAIGIAVLGEEGLSARAAAGADILFADIQHVFAALANPKRLTASLRE